MEYEKYGILYISLFEFKFSIIQSIIMKRFHNNIGTIKMNSKILTQSIKNPPTDPCDLDDDYIIALKKGHFIVPYLYFQVIFYI